MKYPQAKKLSLGLLFVALPGENRDLDTYQSFSQSKGKRSPRLKLGIALLYFDFYQIIDKYKLTG